MPGASAPGILHPHLTYEGLAYADRRQLYGLTVSGYTNAANGRIPFVALSWCPVRCY